MIRTEIVDILEKCNNKLEELERELVKIYKGDGDWDERESVINNDKKVKLITDNSRDTQV